MSGLITLPEGPEHIFVFGSNLDGRHGAGAARYAQVHYGAEYGVGEGPTGRCYALPTVGHRLERMTFHDLKFYVARFLEHARKFPGQVFWLTPVGCGLAGFTVEQVGPLFANAPANVKLPEEFLPYVSP